MMTSRDVASALAGMFILTSAAPSLAASGPISYFQKEKATVAGHKIELDHPLEANVDCTPIGVPAVEVTTLPKHGRLSSERGKIFPVFQAPNPRVKCNNRKIEGLLIYYTPAARFTGQDFVEYKIAFSDGHVIDAKISIDVK